MSGIVHSARVGIIGKQSEVDLALEMAGGLPKGAILSADKGFDSGKFTQGCRRLGVNPHPMRKSRGSSVDGRTTRHGVVPDEHEASPPGRKDLRLGQIRGEDAPGHKVGLAFELTASAYNIPRLAKLA